MLFFIFGMLIFVKVKQQQNNTTMEEITIKQAILESEVFFSKYHNSTIGWCLSIEASDNKKYIYTEDESRYPTKEKFKDYVLGQVLDDLGETAYKQLETIIDRI